MQRLNALYAEIEERGGAKGQPLPVATVRRLHAVLHKALNDAAKQDLVAYNVASKATLPKRDIHLDQPNDKRFKVWNAEELRAFLALIGGHPLEPAFVLAANTGMRRGELARLIWEDVDLDGRQIYVRHALGYVNKRAYLKAPKTNRPRTIGIDAGTVATLRARRRVQAGGMAEAGVRELRDHLSKYLERVREGEVIVTDRGTAVARVVPIEQPRPYDFLVAEGIIEPSTAEKRTRPKKPVKTDGSVSELLADQRR